MSVSKKKAARRRRRTVTEKEGSFTLSATAKSVLGALPITVVTGLLLLLLFTALLLRVKDPNRYQTITGCTLLYLSAFVGGFAALRLNHRRAPLLCGLGEGTLLLAIWALIGLFLPTAWKGDTSAVLSLLAHVCLLPAAALGAWAGSRGSGQRKRRRKR